MDPRQKISAKFLRAQALLGLGHLAEGTAMLEESVSLMRIIPAPRISGRHQIEGSPPFRKEERPKVCKRYANHILPGAG
jgi:hypothetical protein